MQQKLMLGKQHKSTLQKICWQRASLEKWACRKIKREISDSQVSEPNQIYIQHTTNSNLKNAPPLDSVKWA